MKKFIQNYGEAGSENFRLFYIYNAYNNTPPSFLLTHELLSILFFYSIFAYMFSDLDRLKTPIRTNNTFTLLSQWT